MIGFRIDKVSPEFDEQFVAEGGPIVYGGSDAAIKRLDGGEGHHFRIYCGDGQYVCSGRSLDNDSEDAFAPLDYYASPQYGAVEIRYRRGSTGGYEVL